MSKKTVDIEKINEDLDEIIINFLPNKIVKLVYSPLDSNLDMDELVSIDYCNLTGELLTSSALLNRAGLLKAEVEKEVKLEELDLNQYKAQLEKNLRKKLLADGHKVTGLDKSISNEVRLDASYNAKYKRLIHKQYILSSIESLFWSVKSKDEKLNNLTRGFTPEHLERELIEGTVNDMYINVFEKVIK